MPRHFFIAGAQRSGTTWLYRMLQQHPEITMAEPARPEPKYFLREDASLDSYISTYFHGASTLWLGEKSTSYIEYPAAARRIAGAIPDATVIFMLRDPVERAISNYRFSVANGLESLSLEEAIDSEAERSGKNDIAASISVSPFSYTGRGHYARFLDQWTPYFPPERIHLLVTERTVGSEAAVSEVMSSLGLSGDVPLQGVLDSINGSGDADVVIRKATRDKLRRIFAESNDDLASRFGVDTGAWQ